MRYMDLAKAAYEDYAALTDWKNFQGLSMPQWTDLPEQIQKAWCAASASVVHHVLRDVEAATEMSNTEIVPARSTI